MARDDAETLQIRSFRVCFQLERRLHKIDKWRLPVPYGVPLRGIAYWALTLGAVLVLGSLPIVGALLGSLHPSLRYIALPIGGAYALLRWKVDGRPAHATALAWVRFRLEPKRLAAFRRLAAPGQVRFAAVTVAPDERSARFRRGVVTGSGTAVLRYPVRTSTRGRTLQVRADGDDVLWRGKQVRLRPGQRLVIR